MLKRGRILTEEEARAKVRLWNNKAIHREAEEKRSRCPAVASDNGVTTVGDGVKRSAFGAAGSYISASREEQRLVKRLDLMQHLWRPDRTPPAAEDEAVLPTMPPEANEAA